MLLNVLLSLLALQVESLERNFLITTARLCTSKEACPFLTHHPHVLQLEYHQLTKGLRNAFDGLVPFLAHFNSRNDLVVVFALLDREGEGRVRWFIDAGKGLQLGLFLPEAYQKTLRGNLLRDVDILALILQLFQQVGAVP